MYAQYVLIRQGQGQSITKTYNAFFGINDRKFRIGRKTVSRGVFSFEVIMYAARKGFFICTGYDTHMVAHWQPCIHYSLHTIKTRYRRTFVVHGTAAINFSVLEHCGKWRIFPIAGSWNNVHMHKYADFASVVAELSPSRIAIAVSGFKPLYALK